VALKAKVKSHSLPPVPASISSSTELSLPSVELWAVLLVLLALVDLLSLSLADAAARGEGQARSLTGIDAE
jgi:hypothetical protein